MTQIDVHSSNTFASPWRIWLTDTIAVTSFFTIVGGINEYFVVGMSLEEVVQTRLFAVPILILTGAIYGLWRDGVHRMTGFARRSSLAQLVIDTFTCLIFRVPVYGVILLLGGAEGEAFLKGLAGGALIILFSGRPCGIAIDTARRLTGLRRMA